MLFAVFVPRRTYFSVCFVLRVFLLLFRLSAQPTLFCGVSLLAIVYFPDSEFAFHCSAQQPHALFASLWRVAPFANGALVRRRWAYELGVLRRYNDFDCGSFPVICTGLEWIFPSTLEAR